ncbi:NEAT domain-containing protein [Paenibacillus doosanensis]|uniref:NEAT domain-containing protein n=1 Tax=Paenibacillus doosanensis TaxID=1229154 RepID=UPI002180716A|nr:NEAT domain-containing protein [Paenibacillus doosanensis]MCS7460317.1 NEAT domain-containing protein [Paenibacillus doosanensis]
MKSNRKQSIAIWLSLALFLSSFFSAFHINTGTALAAEAITDGEHAAQYRYLKDNTNESSAANPFMSVENSGKLIVQNGKIQFEHQITKSNYNYFQYLGFRKPGAAKAVINPVTQEIQGMDGYQTVPVRDASDSSGNKIVTYDVEDIAKKPDVLMHIVIKNDPAYPGLDYDYWYNVQLSINTGDEECATIDQPVTFNLEQLQSLVAESKSVTASTYEGTNLGEYPTGSKQQLNTNISLAEEYIASGNPSPELINSVYNALTKALDTYKFSVNSQEGKTELFEQYFASQEAYKNMHEIGYAECKEGYTYPPVTPGEYRKGSKDSLNTYLTSTSSSTMPRTVLQNVYATASQIRTATNRLKYYQPNEYAVVETPKLIVLDSLQPTSVPSNKAPELAGTATFINTLDNSDALRANLTFIGAAPEEMVQSTAHLFSQNYGAGFSIEGLDYANEAQRALPLLKSSDEQKKVYQVIVRGSGSREPYWEGRSYIRYKLNGETKEVYISYNGNQLDALNRTLSEAQNLYDYSEPLAGQEQAFADAKADLQTKLADAKPIAANLAAIRPDIVAANDALTQALDVFKTTATAVEVTPLYYSAVDAAGDTFSSMDNYFLKPASVSTVGGATYVSFTIKDSTTIKEFKVKSGNEYVDTTVVSEDTAANTRVVRFKVDNLAALIDAKVHIVVAAQNYDKTYDIRLNLNGVDNSALAQAVSAAKTLIRSAVVGTEPGQYPQAAKDALQAAVNTAGAEASNVTGTTEKSAAALQALEQAVNTFKASVNVKNPDPGTGIADGEYAIDFAIYKKGSDEKSVMYDYVDAKSGKLTVIGGKYYVSFALKQSAEIKSFKTEVNGVLTETETVSEDTAANTRVVRFEVGDLNARLNGWVKIYWQLPPPIGLYDHEYEVELGFSNLPTGNPENPGNPDPSVDKSLLQSVIGNAQTIYNNAVEGSAFGQYPAGSKAELLAALEQAQAVNANSASTQQQVDAAKASLQQALDAFLALVIKTVQTLPDGEYKIAYQLFQKGTGNTSPLADYADPASGKLVVQSGKMYVSLQLKKSSELTSFQTKPDGSLVDSMVLDTDAAADTRIVRFDVADLTKRLEGLAKSTANGGQEYAFEIGFGAITVDLASPVKDGNYSFSFSASSSDPDAAPISNWMESAGTLKVQSGKQLATFKLKKGVTVKTIKQYNQDGSFNKDLTPQYAAAQPGTVRALANEETTSLQFETDDLQATYALALAASDGTEAEYKLQFSSVAPVSSIPGTIVNNNNRKNSSSGGSSAVVTTNTIADGKYKMNYTVLKYGTDEQSVMQTYVVTPGLLTVKSGKQYFSFELKQSKEITAFKTDLNGTLNDAAVVSNNEAANTRVVQFEVSDLASKLKAWVKIDWAEMNYFHEYDVQITFDQASMSKVSDDFTLGSEAAAGSDKPSTPSAKTDFADMKNHWAKAAVERAAALGIVNGYEDGSFRPEGEISRAEFTVMVSRALKLDSKGTKLPFADMNSIPSWALPSLEQAVGAGIINSYEDGTFRADRKITRAEIAVMVARALKLPLDNAEAPAFADAKRIPDWATAQVAAAAKAGIINGRDNNLFAPQDRATRAEAVTLIVAMLDHSK